jgi:threonine dehydrogenase-like Zn-dependent dehydrogenase
MWILHSLAHGLLPVPVASTALLRLGFGAAFVWKFGWDARWGGLALLRQGHLRALALRTTETAREAAAQSASLQVVLRQSTRRRSTRDGGNRSERGGGPRRAVVRLSVHLRPQISHAVPIRVRRMSRGLVTSRRLSVGVDGQRFRVVPNGYDESGAAYSARRRSRLHVLGQCAVQARPGGHVGYVGVAHNVELLGEELFFSHVHLHGGPAPVRRFLPELIDLIWRREVEPGKVFDLTLPLEQAAEGYKAMDQRRAIKTLLTL